MALPHNSSSQQESVDRHDASPPSPAAPDDPRGHGHRLVLRAAGILLALLGLVPVANLIGAGAIPWWSLATREWTVRGILLVVLSCLLVRIPGDHLARAEREVHRALLRPAPRWFALAAALGATSAAAVVSLYCFSGRPFTSDEMAQLWQARLLVAGRLSIPAEPLAAFFNTAPAYDLGPRWFTQYPVGASVPAALGLAIGAVWLVNPILLGAAVACWYDFARRTFGESLARCSALLLVASPFVLLMAGTQMSHVPALALVCLALAALARWECAEASEAWRPALVLGGTVGALGAIRPYDGVLLAVVTSTFQLATLVRRRELVPSLVPQLGVVACLVTLILVANVLTTGAPLTFAYDLLNGPVHRVGFHVDPNGDPHTPLRGLRITSGYFMRFDRFLFEWPIPALVPVAAALLLLRRPTRWDTLLLALLGAFTVGYWAYWFDGFFDGPRFLFPVVPVLVLYAARFPLALGERFHSRDVARGAVLLLVLCVVTAWTLPGVSSAVLRLRSYATQRAKLKTDVAGQVRRAHLTNALVFVHESWRGTLLARLRLAGMNTFAAERAVNALDACALEEALGVSGITASAPDERAAQLARVLTYARAAGPVRPVSGDDAAERVALNAARVPSQACLDAYAADQRFGVMPYARFLAEQHVAADGRVGGDVVFVRDLGAANARLRERFPGRRWYRYRQPAGLDDKRNPFIPY